MTNKDGVNGIDVICPGCDSDLFAFEDAVEVLSSLSTLRKIISLSTKASIPKNSLERIAMLNKELIKHDSFIKISVALSSFHSVDSIEEGTANFEERLRNLKLLQHYDIPSSIYLRPLLPFVSDEEYKQIIDETSPYTRKYLLGGLFVDRESEFYTKFLQGNGHLRIRDKQVQWITSKPQWKYVDLPEKEDYVQRNVHSKGGMAFHSDLNLLDSIRQELF
ncbi:hypothetical protein CEE36_00570 [candidate division TA06 bacterium B3_TA06]|uniref:Radical SAM core domain-containing protein n=1 Tax=candidate division TA06 bacterium B3_TA06 TaxID=2012487 RepID=A0A532VAS1_UNCT6|nr:MAG: hypothetical protein CEE36_00570 [candidate division TA06 bacterium B3_TA06]